MEVIIVFIVIAVIAVILGVNVTSIAQALMGLIVLVLGAMLLFFIISAVILLIAKPEKGELDGFEKPEKGYETAMYKCGSERFRNIFPAENIIRDAIYKPGIKKLRVYRGKQMSFVIDRHSAVIIILGLVLTLPSLIAVIAEMKNM